MGDKDLDLRGGHCPKPLVDTMSALKTLSPGQTLSVTCDDPQMLKAVPTLCERAGLVLVAMEESGGVIRFTIRR